MNILFTGSLITWIINSNGLSSMGFTISGFPIF